MRVNSPAWRNAVRAMRVLAPIGFIGSVVLGTLAYQRGSNGALAVDAFCAGVNAMLTWIEWYWFEI